jgi:hypothetical protein
MHFRTIHSIDRILKEDAMTEQRKGKSRAGDEGEDSAEKRADKFGGRTVGRGMDSPDSTEAVLDASTAEPDPRARETPARGTGSRKK